MCTHNFFQFLVIASFETPEFVIVEWKLTSLIAKCLEPKTVYKVCGERTTSFKQFNWSSKLGSEVETNDECVTKEAVKRRGMR